MQVELAPNRTAVVPAKAGTQGFWIPLASYRQLGRNDEGGSFSEMDYR
jgi:hypothetical protein